MNNSIRILGNDEKNTSVSQTEVEAKRKSLNETEKSQKTPR